MFVGFNKYNDAKGRLIEVGEIENGERLIEGVVDDGAGYASWFSKGVLKDVTVMVYDDDLGNLGSGNYTRNRLYMVGRYTPGGVWNRNNLQYVSYMSYDVHGNVQSVLNMLKGDNVLRRDVVKRIDYEYDLVSGDVKRVYYQKGKVDQLIHRYEYDERGRLNGVWTSHDGEFWDRDGKYFYYEHGPLARVEVGDAKVQGLDYVYTMQGWIKGMNGDLLNGGALDYGRDGNASGFEGEAEAGIHRYVGGDVAGFVMGYYDSLGLKGDYGNIGGVAVSGLSNTGLKSLWNGNIASMSTVMMKNEGAGGFVAEGVRNLYGYDQLNRLWRGDGYVYDGSGVFGSGSVYYGFGVGGALQVVDGYDANGNILMQRRDVGGVGVANYSYHYSKLGDRLVSNRLYHVGGLNSAGDAGFDIEDVVGTGCYGYDGIGELVKDRANGIERIDWDMFGKVRRVVRSAGSLLPDLEFRYDGMGRRVCKIVKPRDEGNRSLLPESDWLWEWYVRDLDGNVMAMYEDSMDVNGVAWQRLEGHPVYGSGRLGMDNAGRVVARQGGILIGCVDFAGRTSIAGFYLSVNGNVVVNAYYSSVSSLIAAIEATGVYEAYWDGYLLKLWYIGGNPTATWVVLARTWGLEVPSTKLSVEQCVDEGEMLSTTEFRHVVGAKVYEVSNHLGNVLATVSDRRERVMSGSVVSGFGAVIKSTSDYCEIGHALSVHCRRMWVFDANRYKFGFGGQEADQEIAGDKSMYTAQFWEYDAKIGRRWNVDPMFGSYSHQSTYAAFNNNPIIYSDPLGLEGEEQNDNTLGYYDKSSSDSKKGPRERPWEKKSEDKNKGGGSSGAVGKVADAFGSGWNKLNQWHASTIGNYQNPMEGPSPRVTMEELGGALNVFSVMGPLGGVVAKTTIWTALSLTSSVLSATANAKGDDVLERNMFTGDKAKIAYNLVKTGISIRGLYTGGKDLIKEGPEMINVLNIGLDGAGSYTGGGKTFNMVNEYINKQQKPIIGGKQGQNAGGINNDNVKKNEKLEASKKVKHT